MVEGVYEVGAELHLESLRDLEVLLQAQVKIRVTRAAQPAQLRRASSESPCSRHAEVAVVVEPLVAAEGGTGDSSLHVRDRIAVWTRAAGVGAGLVATA